MPNSNSTYLIIIFIEKFVEKCAYKKNYIVKNSQNSSFSYGIDKIAVQEDCMNVQIGTVSSLLCI